MKASKGCILQHFFFSYLAWEKKPPTNLKVIFHLAVHAAWSVVELVRTCDNLTFSCGHFNKHLLPLLGRSGSCNPPAWPCPLLGAVLGWGTAGHGRLAGEERKVCSGHSFWGYCCSCWTPDRYQRWVCSALTFGDVPGEAGVVCLSPGSDRSTGGAHGVSGTSPSASSPALSQQGKKLKELLFIWLFAALFCGEMRGLTQVHIKHYCHSRSFKMVNRWKKKSRWDGCVLTHMRQGDLLWHTVPSQCPV